MQATRITATPRPTPGEVYRLHAARPALCLGVGEVNGDCFVFYRWLFELRGPLVGHARSMPAADFHNLFSGSYETPPIEAAA